MSLKVAAEKEAEESCRVAAESKVKLEATIERLKGENEALMNSQKPQVIALQTQIANFAKENSKLRHQVKVRLFTFI